MAISEGAQVLDSLKAAEFLAGRSGSSAIFSVPQDKVLQIQRALDLERAGEPTAGQTLFALRKELGGAKFDGVYDTLSNSNLRVIDNAEAAKFKGKGLSGLTPEQDAVADRLGNEFAQTIIKKGQQDKYRKNKVDYIRDKLSSGRLVEEIGESKVRDFYNDPKAEVWSNVYLQAKDAAGNDIGGQQAELDFFIHYTDNSSPSEIVSAKLDGKKARPKTDREHLSTYYDLKLDTSEALRSDLKNRFGGDRSPYGKTETQIYVKYTDVKTGATSEIPLSEFRKRISEPSRNSETNNLSTTVRVLAPDDTKLKEGRDIKLGVSREVLFNTIIEVVDKKI